MDVRFGYGGMCDTLEKQANDQGLTLGKDAETLEKIRFSINMVGFHVATDSQIQLMTKKLHKKVMDATKFIEKE